MHNGYTISCFAKSKNCLLAMLCCSENYNIFFLKCLASDFTSSFERPACPAKTPPKFLFQHFFLFFPDQPTRFFLSKDYQKQKNKAAHIQNKTNRKFIEIHLVIIYTHFNTNCIVAYIYIYMLA